MGWVDTRDAPTGAVTSSRHGQQGQGQGPPPDQRARDGEHMESLMGIYLPVYYLNWVLLGNSVLHAGKSFGGVKLNPGQLLQRCDCRTRMLCVGYLDHELVFKGHKANPLVCWRILGFGSRSRYEWSRWSSIWACGTSGHAPIWSGSIRGASIDPDTPLGIQSYLLRFGKTGSLGLRVCRWLTWVGIFHRWRLHCDARSIYHAHCCIPLPSKTIQRKLDLVL